MKNFLPIIFLALLVGFFGCSQDAVIQSDFTIKSGSSFGMCIGDCYQEMTFNEFQAVLKTAEINRSGLQDLKVKNKRSVSDQEWQEIESLIDEQAFLSLSDVIGCPDCADGGAEWIEIKSSDLVKKVTFEYRQAPAEIEQLANRLREVREGLYPEES